MDDLLIAVRAIVSLATVLGLLLWVTHVMKKRQTSGASTRPALPRSLAKLTAMIPARSDAGAARANRPEKITVVARSGLGGKAQLVVAEFGGIRYILGVTENGVSVVDTQEPSPQSDVSRGDVDDVDSSYALRQTDRGETALKPVA
jgi:flagellar protein FliO/FliZ